MQLDWLYSPITQYSITGVGLVASLCLWISAKAELRALRRKFAKELEALQNTDLSLIAGLAEVRAANQTAAEAAFLPRTSQTINLTKRAQILRMHHRGESVHSIAAALQLPQGEVELVLKLERITETEPAATTR
jgi:hypothetical protein